MNNIYCKKPPSGGFLCVKIEAGNQEKINES